MKPSERRNATATDAFLRSLYPNGEPTDILEITNVPAQLPSLRKADVVQLAPTADQSIDQVNLEAAVRQAITAMKAGAVLYMIVPRRWRRGLARSSRRHGLTVSTPVVHLHSGDARYFVPLSPRCLEFAIRTWPQSSRWRQVVRLLKALPRTRITIASVLPNVGFAAHRRDTQLCDWLLGRFGRAGNCEVIVATSWRGISGPTLVFAFCGTKAEPSLVAKLVPIALIAQARREAAMLTQLGPAAEAAGACVPHLIDYSETVQSVRLVQSAIAGQPASILLRQHSAELPRTVTRISTWLARWHSGTVRRLQFTGNHCEQLVLGPARSLVAELAQGPEYLSWLSSACSRLKGSSLPFVSAHNDLTMTNILIDRRSTLGVVDWEMAVDEGLPFADFWYAVCDAVAVRGDHPRLWAFDQCFGKDGEYRGLVADCQQRLLAAVDAPRQWLDLCFHACWLRHAANEQSGDSSTSDRPFLLIARRLADLALRGDEIVPAESRR